MKKLFFRWKDEFCNGTNPELIEMTGKEFLEFKRNPENKHRKFIEFVDEYNEAPTIVIEATQERYDEWHKEEERKRRRKQQEKKRAYKLVSMDEEIPSIESGEITLHDVLPDENVIVEDDAIKNCMISRLREAVKELSKDESELIANLYLVENPLTEKAYAEYLGVSQQEINKKKLIVLEKLRKIF